MKTSKYLVEYCNAQLGHPYWMGTYGQIATKALYEANKKRLPQYYTASDFLNQLGQRVYDCCGLIKGARWSATPESVPVYNASQDVPVSGLYAQCSKKGPISTIPEIPGTCVFIPNQHVGVYVGNGYVIEARGHAYGVVKTKLKERPWVYWGMLSWIDYGASETYVSVKAREIKKGDSGNAVRTLQAALNARGYNCGTIDGDFGFNTDKALRAYQKSAGLTADGICGVNTWTVLLK